MGKGLASAAHHAVASAGLDRRREVRLRAPSRLRAALPPGARQLSVHDIGVGGLSIILPVPIEPGSLHTLCLTLDSMTVFHLAQAVYCRGRIDGSWMAGLAFIGHPPAGGPTIEDLLSELLASMISFD